MPLNSLPYSPHKIPNHEVRKRIEDRVNKGETYEGALAALASATNEYGTVDASFADRIVAAVDQALVNTRANQRFDFGPDGTPPTAGSLINSDPSALRNTQYAQDLALPVGASVTDWDDSPDRYSDVRITVGEILAELDPGPASVADSLAAAGSRGGAWDVDRLTQLLVSTQVQKDDDGRHLSRDHEKSLRDMLYSATRDRVQSAIHKIRESKSLEKAAAAPRPRLILKSQREVLRVRPLGKAGV